MEFVKMHGLGNDYVYLDLFRHTAPDDPAKLSVEMAKPHTGIGSDGLILIEPSDVADAKMRIFNADGSEAPMCGNGLRCVGKYVYDSGICTQKHLCIETMSGIRTLDLIVENGVCTGSTADMGVPVFDDAPVICRAAGCDWPLLRVDVGSKHGVCYLDELPDDTLFRQAGPVLERDHAFPDRANIEFCVVRDDTHVDALVWERGSGATACCGTGATACLVAGALLERTGRTAWICLPGGELYIEWRKNGHAFMTGPAELTFVGDWRK